MVEFYYPENLKEALELRRDKELLPLAGGTDLMVKYENWSSLPARFPQSVMAVGHLEELQFVKEEEGFLCIGGGLSLSRALEIPHIPSCLAQAIDGIAAPALRNRATLAGNIQNASPAGDSLPPLILMDARLRLVNTEGFRDITVREFMTGPGRTVLKPYEIIESIRIPLSFVEEEAKGTLLYKKVGTRRANALSKLSVCFWARKAEGRLADIRFALGAVAATIVRLPEVENVLKGCALADLPKVWAEQRPAYEQAIRPIDDQRSTAAHRKGCALRLMDAFIKDLAEF